MGTDFASYTRGFMFSLGGIQALKYGSGQCPTGVIASDARLQWPGSHGQSRPRYVTQIQGGVAGFSSADGGIKKYPARRFCPMLVPRNAPREAP